MSDAPDSGLLYAPGFTSAQRRQFFQINEQVIYISETTSLDSVTNTFTKLALPVVVPSASNLNVAYNNQTNLGEFILGRIGNYLIDFDFRFSVSGQQNPANANRMAVIIQLRAYDSSGNLVSERESIETIFNGPVGGGTDRYSNSGSPYTYNTTMENSRVAIWVRSDNAPGLTITTTPGVPGVSGISINYVGGENVNVGP